MDLEEFKEKVKKSKLNGSYSTFYFTYGNEEYRKGINTACYVEINVKEPIHSLSVFHPRIEEYKPYINFLLSSKYLGKCFVTKQAEKGFKGGFVIDCSQPANTIRAAIISLRSPFEHKTVGGWFNKLKSWGVSSEEAFFFSICMRASRDYLETSLLSHGIAISDKTFLGDIISGTLYNEILPLNISGTIYPKRQAGYLGRKFKELFPKLDSGNIMDSVSMVINNPEYHKSISALIKKHPQAKKGVRFGRQINEVPVNKRNMLTLIDLYKKEYML